MLDFKYFYLLEAAQFEPKEILTKANFSDEQADDLIKQLTGIILPYGEIDKSAKKLKYLYPLAAFLTNPNVNIAQVKQVFDQYMSNEKARNSNLIYKTSIYDHMNMRGDFNAFKASVSEQDKKAEPQQAQKEISAEDKKIANIRKAKQILTLKNYNDYLEREGLPKKERMDRDDYLKVKENKIEDLINNQLSSIQKAIEKYPDDENTIDASYMVPLAKFINQSGRPVDVFNTFDEYMSVDRLKNEKAIFKYEDFLKFAGDVHQEISSSLSLKKIKSSKMDESEAVYVDKDVAVYCATTEDIFESIQRSIKYGQGNKYGLCISSKSHNFYTNYRFRNATTTYFAYFKDPNAHNPNFIIVDALQSFSNSINAPDNRDPYAAANREDDNYDDYNDLDYNDLEDNTETPVSEKPPEPPKSNYITADKYSWNPIVPNKDEEITKANLVSKFPQLRNAFSKDVFKVLPISKKEREQKEKYDGKELQEFNNIKDKIELIRFEHKADFTEDEQQHLGEISQQEAEVLLKEILINRPELNIRTIQIYKNHPNLFEKYLKGALDDAETEFNGQDQDDEEDEEDDEETESVGLRLKVEYARAFEKYPEMFKRYFSLLKPHALQYHGDLHDLVMIFQEFPQADDLINYDYFFKTDNKVIHLKEAFVWMRDEDMQAELKEKAPKAYNYLHKLVEDVKLEQYDNIVNNFRERIALSDRQHGKAKWWFSFYRLAECPNFEEIIKVNNFTPEEIKKLNKANIFFDECIFVNTDGLTGLDYVSYLSFKKCFGYHYKLPKKVNTLHIEECKDNVYCEDIGRGSQSKITNLELNSSKVIFADFINPTIKNLYVTDCTFKSFIGLPQKLSTLHFTQKHVGQTYNKPPSFEGIPKIIDDFVIDFSGATKESHIDALGLDKYKPESFNKGTNKFDGRTNFGNSFSLGEYAMKKMASSPKAESFGGFLKSKSFLFEDLYKRMG